jgi:hypothetical protein
MKSWEILFQYLLNQLQLNMSQEIMADPNFYQISYLF